jgi:hypothetical protein
MRVLAWVWLIMGSLGVGVAVVDAAAFLVARRIWIGLLPGAWALIIFVPGMIGGWLRVRGQRAGPLLLAIASVMALIHVLIFALFAHEPEISRLYVPLAALALVPLSLATLARS